MATAGWRCQAQRYDFLTDLACSGALVVHHRQPKGMGASRDPLIHSLTNLAVLCTTHHVEVHDRPTHSYACGLLLHR